ncbi:MAG: hypothetical protein U9N72_05650 [Bacteroidota bacterium]|nr:hypothetical protein [Bacteroidota bacterium]
MVLTSEEIEEINKQPTNNPEAYNLYMRGRFFWHRRTEVDLKRSLEYFTRVLQLDSTYALSYAGLADVYFIMAWWDWYPKNEGYNMGKEYALKALSLNDGISEAHATLGGILTWYDWKYKEAEKELKKAISLNPNYATGHQYYAELLDVLGRDREAREQIDIAKKQNPYAYVMHSLSALFYYHNSEYARSIEAKKESIEISDFLEHHNELLLKNYIRLGMTKEALEEINYIVSASDQEIQLVELNDIYLDSGIKGALIWFIDWFTVNQPYEFYTIASLYALAEDDDRTIEWLEKGLRLGDAEIPRINNSPDFDFIREDPRFIALLGKMNLADQ